VPAVRRAAEIVPARALAALLALGALAGPGLAQGPPGRPLPVKVAPVTERPVADELHFIASVEPSVQTTVGAEVAGRVIALAVDEGQRVARDALLVRLDPVPREIQRREALAVVARAQEELDKLRRGSRPEEVAQREAEAAEQAALLERAQHDYQRARKLYDDQIISLAELQLRESEYRATRQRHQRTLEALRMARAGPRAEEIAQAAAELEAARARADRIADEIRRGSILAPVAAFVVRKRVDVGAWVQPGTPVVDLVALDPVQLTGPVGEREIRRVQPGQRATATLDAFPGRSFAGTVTAVVPVASAESRTFPVKVTVANPEALLKAGMFARVAVRTGGDRTGLFVPKDAVVRRAGQPFVFVVGSDTVRMVRVETGVEAAGLVEVRGDGLAAGQRAVTLGSELLQPGARVTVVP
jgi:multidrug efflux pump subunit AcrA (membrane-fusion protein)